MQLQSHSTFAPLDEQQGKGAIENQIDHKSSQPVLIDQAAEIIITGGLGFIMFKLYDGNFFDTIW